jgi:hypothetical protein
LVAGGIPKVHFQAHCAARCALLDTVRGLPRRSLVALALPRRPERERWGPFS